MAPASAVVGVLRLSSPEIRRRPAAACDFTADVHPILRRVYAARGLQNNADLDLSLDRLLPVGSLEGLDAAAQLLAAHRAAGRVLVIGDFDADGATSTALVVRGLRAMHFAHVDFLVPNRFRFGYGLTPEIVALAATRRPSLIVTVDNGVSSLAGVQAARNLGIPLLVTDHRGRLGICRGAAFERGGAAHGHDRGHRLSACRRSVRSGTSGRDARQAQRGAA